MIFWKEEYIKCRQIMINALKFQSNQKFKRSNFTSKLQNQNYHKKLQITSITIVQMRPKFRHLDKSKTSK